MQEVPQSLLGWPLACVGSWAAGLQPDFASLTLSHREIVYLQVLSDPPHFLKLKADGLGLCSVPLLLVHHAPVCTHVHTHALPPPAAAVHTHTPRLPPPPPLQCKAQVDMARFCVS